MDRYDDDQGVELREYLAVLRARRGTIVLVAILVTGAAIGFSLMQEPMYTAQSRVLVESSVPFGSTSILPPQVNLETQREIATSEPVAALVIEDLGLDRSIDSVLGGLSVEGVSETEVLRFSYTSTTPELARDAANSFARNYIHFREQQAIEGINVTENAARQRLAAASNQLAEIEQDLESAEVGGDEALIGTLESQRNALIARLGVLQQRLDDIRAQRSSDLSSGQVIEDAALPGAPSSPNYTTNAVLGALLGLGLGIGLAFLRERLDDRFRGRSDVEEAVGAPVIATVPRFKQDKKAATPALVTVTHPRGTTSEVYRGLRTNLSFIASQSGLKTLLVTSGSAGEGKSVTVANLAVAMAQAGSRVIVVSADMRKPTIERYFNLPRSHHDGLASWLLETGDTRRPNILDPGIPNMRVLSCGPLPPNPAELLTSPRLLRLIDFLEVNADFVIFDSPPVLAVSDSTILATHVGGIVLVVDASTTHRSATTHATEELQRVGGRLVGVVLNNFDPSASRYYYGPYNYYGDDADLAIASSNGSGSGIGSDGRKRRLFQRR